MSKSASVLIIDDEPCMHRLLTRLLSAHYAVHLAVTGEEGLRKSETLRPDLILLDLNLPHMSGLSVLEVLSKTRKDTPVIIITGYGQVDSAVQALKLGAVDYIRKPLDCEKFLAEIHRLIERNEAFQKRSPSRARTIGESSRMKQAWQLAERFAPTDIPVLVQGETGTGKELFAHAIHELSRRSEGPLVTIDCAGLPEELMESELFGYEKGAFTGADKTKPGRVAWANGGTLFMDEIALLRLSCQGKLLRLVEQQGFLPLGARASRWNVLDVRFISATNIPLADAVRQGAFRDDLYHRFNGMTIELPPLREREGDVELLVHHFLEKYRQQYNQPHLGISPAAMKALCAYPWPGNVRELLRVVMAAAVMAKEEIRPEDLPPRVLRRSLPPGPGQLKLELNLNCDLGAPIDLKSIKEWAGVQAETQIIQEVQRKVRLTKGELAKFLGVDPKTLRSRLKELI